MPITDTLGTSRRLQEAGVPPKQAEVFSELLEETAKAAQQDLKSFITEQFDVRFEKFEARIEAKLSQMDGRISQAEARLLREMRQQVIWIVGLLLGFGTAILGVVKLLFY